MEAGAPKPPLERINPDLQVGVGSRVEQILIKFVGTVQHVKVQVSVAVEVHPMRHSVVTIVSGDPQRTTDVPAEYAVVVSVKSVGPDVHEIKILISVSIVIPVRCFGNVTGRGHP